MQRAMTESLRPEGAAAAGKSEERGRKPELHLNLMTDPNGIYSHG